MKQHQSTSTKQQKASRLLLDSETPQNPRIVEEEKNPRSIGRNYFIIHVCKSNRYYMSRFSASYKLIHFTALCKPHLMDFQLFAKENSLNNWRKLKHQLRPPNLIGKSIFHIPQIFDVIIFC